jgi:hypothetical protein
VQNLKSLPALDLSDEIKARASSTVTPDEKERASKYNRINRRPIFDKADPLRSDRYIHIDRYQYGAPDGSVHLNDSDLVVYGKILSESPHLTSNGGSVYSTFLFSPSQKPIKGDVPPNSPLILERQGGVVLYPSGHLRLEGIEGMGIPQPGTNYLLFLRHEPHGYKIVAGFYIDGSRPQALDARDDSITPSSNVILLDTLKTKVISKQ